MMGELIIIKHAAPRIVEDLPSSQWVLSESGKRQCEGLYSRLAPYEPARLYTSEQPKAVQTAETLSSRAGVPFLSRPGLHENDREGLPFFHHEEELQARIQAFFLQPSERIVGNESADEAHSRFVGAVQETLSSAADQRTVIVSHGTVTTLLVARANQLDPYPFWRDLELTSFVVLSTPSFALRDIVHPGVDPVQLRPATQEDSDFAFLVKERAFRHQVESVWGWDDEEQRQLHGRRFDTQEFSVVENEGIDVGVLAKVATADHVNVKQLFILPEYQGRGIGREVMHLVIRAGSEARQAVELRVLKVNSRALSFFESLGFKTYSETETHHLLRRDANS